MNPPVILDATLDSLKQYGVCGYKNSKTPGFNEKMQWIKDRFQEGLKIKLLISEEHGAQGMIEYIPGEYCWRPVDARGYMFIHCLFVGFKKQYKGRGYASMLIEACEKEAMHQAMFGVAVVTRKGPFMVGSDIFLRRGYQPAGKASPDFELWVRKFSEEAPLPRIKNNLHLAAEKYADGLTLIRSDQCPYTVKNMHEIAEIAERQLGQKPRIVTWKNHFEAQNSPIMFGTFGIIHAGKIIAEHPISATRFANILKTIHAG